MVSPWTMPLIWPLLSAIYLIAFSYNSLSDLGFNIQLRFLDTDFLHVSGISSEHLTYLGELHKPSSSWFIDIWNRINSLFVGTTPQVMSLCLMSGLSWISWPPPTCLCGSRPDRAVGWQAPGDQCLAYPPDFPQSLGASTYSFSAVLHLWSGLDGVSKF